MSDKYQTKSPDGRPGHTTDRRLMTCLAFIILVASPSFAAATPLLHSPALWGAWSIETINPPALAAISRTDLAIDSTGKLHTVWNEGGPSTTYATRDTSGWTSSYVGARSAAAIALTAADKPVIVFANVYGGTLLRSIYNGASWSEDVIDLGGGAEPRVAIDDIGTVHVAYMSPDTTQVLYAYNDGGGWVLETVEAIGAGLDLTPVSLDVDSLGRPHVAYSSDAGAGVLRHAYRTSPGAWTIEIVDTAGGNFAAIAIDSLDVVHIAYMGIPEQPRYATNAGGAWSIEIPETKSPCWHYAIDVDSENKPHVTYRCFSRGNPQDQKFSHLSYVRKTSVGWLGETVDWTGNNGHSSTIKLDANDRPHVAYYFNSEQQIDFDPLNPQYLVDLRYATPTLGAVSRTLGDP